MPPADLEVVCRPDEGHRHEIHLQLPAERRVPPVLRREGGKRPGRARKADSLVVGERPADLNLRLDIPTPAPSDPESDPSVVQEHRVSHATVASE